MRRTVAASIGILVLALGACGGDGNIIGGSAPKMEVSDGTNPVGPNGSVTVTAQLGARITVANTGSGPLELRDIKLTSVPEGAFVLSTTPTPTVAEPIVINADDIAHEFYVSLVPGVADRPTGRITLTTNKTIAGTTEFVFDLVPEAAAPRLLAQPQVVNFETVGENSSSTKPVALLNTGAANLEIKGFFLSGHPGYTVEFAGQTYTVTAETASTGITLAAPVNVAAGASEHLSVTYTSAGPEPAEGMLVLLTNDPAAPNGTTIQMFANVAGPCISVNPTRVEFGGKLVGQEATINLEIESCGDIALKISDVVFTDDGAGAFGMVDVALGTLPLDLQPGQKLYLPVTYFPAAVSPIGAGGVPELDRGTLRITSNAYITNFDVEVSGFGTDGTCPTAAITVAEGEEVIPQTNLHLSSAGSVASSGGVTGWEWSVVQPQGSASVFLPSPYVANPTFEANIVGEYIFRLKVYDALGTPSCEQASYTVYVTSPEAIHVELVWNTPGDVDQTDTGFNGFGESVGSDVDLHFVHPSAVDPWLSPDGYFNSRFDCYWQNTNPNWGGAGTNDDPRLDRDDTDGAGPENLNLSFPEVSKTYKVGVHYWDDWGYGTSFATVRVYIYGQLRMQWPNVQLLNDDMWDAANITWPAGTVTKIEKNGTGSNVPVITSGYYFGGWP